MTGTQRTEPRSSVVALIGQLVDYAGLFPPAKLGMAETVENYARYVGDEDAWILGRLIVPAARLEEFETCAAAFLPSGEDDEPWHLSALVAPAGDVKLPGDLDRIAAFNARHEQPGAGLARIDVIELAAATTASIEDSLDAVPDELFPFFELPIEGDVRGLVATLVGSDAGAKVRTGGVRPEMHPDPADLARFIEACALAVVPIKATAGLHHPLRHHSEAVGTRQFGFLNVFIAATLAFQNGLEEDRIREILTEESPEAFRFGEETLGWGPCELDLDQVARARERFAISFGSCSFDEPREDLRALGLL